MLKFRNINFKYRKIYSSVNFAHENVWKGKDGYLEISFQDFSYTVVNFKDFHKN